MTRYAQNGGLTRFDTGSNHENNPLGGIPIGGNNSVEENETKQNNFVYSNRIFLDSNIVSQYNLPKSLVGKSVADATKFIDNKFKGRNDKISQSTKNGMLSKIAEAQEAMKPAEPEMEQSQEGMIDPTQMAFGGYVNRQMEDGGYYEQNNPYFMQNPGVQQPGIGPMNQIQPVSQLSQANSLSQIKPFSTGNQLPTASAVPDTAGAIGGGLKEMSGKTGLGLSSALGAASTAIDLGKTAFGKPAQDTSGLAPSAKVNSGGMIAGSAMKGASAGMAFGPLGAGIGAAVGGVGGLLGSNKAKKAAIKNANNYAVNVNKQFSDQYAMGGEIDPMYYENLKLTPRNTAPIESISNLKPAGTTVPYTIGTQPAVDISNANRQFAPGPSDLDMLKYNAGKIGNYINQNAGNLARYAPIAANALQLAQLKKPQGERLDRLSNRYKPEYVDEAVMRNIVDQEANNQINALTQSGASQGAVRNAILGAGLNKTKALSDAYMNAAAQNRATNDRAQTFNLGVDQVNLQQSNTEKENFAKDKGNYDTQKSKLIGQLGNDIGNVGKEEIYKKIAKTTTGYSWLGEYQKMNPDATPEEVERAAKKAGVLTDSTTKKALGGYLLKNKGK